MRHKSDEDLQAIIKYKQTQQSIGISSHTFTVIIRAVLIEYVVLAMANKKFLICAALATGLLLTACVKKEEPKNEEQQEQATTQTQPQPEPEKIQEFESLESVDKQEAPAPAVETTREETANTTTEIRREIRPAQTETPAATETPRTEQPKPAKTEQPKAEQPVKAEAKPAKTEQPVKTESKPAKVEQPKAEQTAKAPKSSTPAQSEDDAVAAAIAAATPALNN